MSHKFVNCLPARAVLGIMAFLMFFVTHMVRVNLYIAIVAMMETSKGNVTEGVTNKMEWSESAFGIFLGAFYWSYWITELPGGLLAQRFGGKRVLGSCVTVSAILNFLIPAASKYHYLLASFFRALQGITLGVSWPVMHWLSARWIPLTERSKFMTAYHGAAVGTAITYPVSGIMITHYGWESIFYVTGVLTLIWSFAWWILIYDSPQQHPRLSEEERLYLKEAIGDVVKTNTIIGAKTPWKDILKSKAFWAILIASLGIMWGTITLSMQTPTYFYQMHQLDLKATGFISGIPELGKFFFALIFSCFIDKMIAKKVFTVTTARKLAIVVSEFLPGIFLILLGFFGHSSKVLATVFLTCTCLVGGASSSGSLANVVDLSPNHAGTLLGIIKTLTIVPGVTSPLVVSYFTADLGENKVTQWRNVFLLISFVYIFCSIVYVIFGSGEVQPWNEVVIENKEESAFIEDGKSKDKSNAEGAIND